MLSIPPENALNVCTFAFGGANGVSGLGFPVGNLNFLAFKTIGPFVFDKPLGISLEEGRLALRCSGQSVLFLDVCHPGPATFFDLLIAKEFVEKQRKMIRKENTAKHLILKNDKFIYTPES